MSAPPTPEQWADQLRHGSDDRTAQIAVSIGIMTALSIVFVVLRLFTRWLAKLYYWWDDYTIVFALIANQVSIVLAILGPRYGLGRHEAVVGSENLAKWGQVIFAYELGYIMCITANKLSVLLMYSRLFPVRHLTFKLRDLNLYSIAWWTGFLFTIAWWLTYIFGTIFQCVPIQHFWNRFASKSDPGVCVNIASLYFATFSNIVLDIFILTLPIHQVWQLQMKCTQKIAVLSILLVGSFVCITSIVRVYYIVAVDVTADLTWTHTDSLIWSCVETNVGIICSCLPTLAPLFWCCTGSLRRSFDYPSLSWHQNFCFTSYPPQGKAPPAVGYRSSGRSGGSSKNTDAFGSVTPTSSSRPSRSGGGGGGGGGGAGRDGMDSWSDPGWAGGLQMGQHVEITGGTAAAAPAAAPTAGAATSKYCGRFGACV